MEDFPVKGDVYRDFTDLFAGKEGFKTAMSGFMDMFDREIFDAVVCSESYGGMFGTALAARLGKTVIPVRYGGGFPERTVSVECVNSRGTGTMEMPAGCIRPGMKTIIIADVLATGRTTKAMIDLVEKQGGKVVRIGYIAELEKYGAREKKVLKGYPFECLAAF